MAKNFANLITHESKTQEAQRTQKKLMPKYIYISKSMHIILQMQKTK